MTAKTFQTKLAEPMSLSLLGEVITSQRKMTLMHNLCRIYEEVLQSKPKGEEGSVKQITGSDKTRIPCRKYHKMFWIPKQQD